MPRRSSGVYYDGTRERWVAELWLRDTTGRRYVRRRMATSEAAAKRLRKELERTYEFALSPGDGSQTVAAFLTNWLEVVARERVRASTFPSYSAITRLHLIPSLGRHRLDRLAPQHIQAMMTAKRDAGLSARRVQYMRQVLRTALGQAERWGLISRNPAALVDMPRVVYDKVEAVSPTQAQGILAAVSQDRFAPLFITAIASGCRQGELLALHWKDVDLDAGLLTVKYTLQRINREWSFAEPKTEKSVRTVAIPPVAVEALREWRQRQREERLMAGDRWEALDLVFSTETGAPVHAARVTHRLQALLEAANLPRMRFHDLRHAAATLMLTQGVSPRVIQQTLGHASFTTTMNVYGHVAPELQHDAARRLGAALTGAN